MGGTAPANIQANADAPRKAGDAREEVTDDADVNADVDAHVTTNGRKTASINGHQARLSFRADTTLQS